MLSDYEYFRVVGDCGDFDVEYQLKGGKPTSMRLDAETEDDARYEAAGIAECSPDDLVVEWH